MNKFKFSLIVFAIVINYFSEPCNATNIDSLNLVLENQQGEERVETLLLLGNAFQKSDRNKSIKFFKEAYFLISGDNLSRLANTSYKIAYNYYALKQSDSAIYYYDIALSNYKNTSDSLNMMKTLTMKGLLLQKLGKFGESAKLFKEGVDLFDPYWKTHESESNISKMHLATMMSNYGISLYELGQYDSSLYYATKVYNLRKEIEAPSKQIAKSLVNIGIVYLGANKNDEAIKYFSDANDLFYPLGDSINIRKCYNNIGMAHKQNGDTLGAIKNYNNSLKISRATNDKRGIATTLINLSGLYSRRGETEKAENYLMKSLEIGEELGHKQFISTSNQNLASIYYETGEFKKALEYAKRARPVILETSELDLLEENTMLLSNIYDGLGNSALALKYLRDYNVLHDSLFNADNTERFNRLQTEFETARKEQEIILLTNEKERQLLENEILKNRQLTYIIVIVLILFLAIIVSFMIYLKRKKDKQIHHQKELFHKKEKELAESELEKSKLKEEELQQSVLFKSKQLSTHALHMMQKNTMLQEIQTDIKNMAKKASDDDKPNYKRISQQISQSLRSQKDWDVFKLYFEDVNKEFYQKLNEINPDLTTNDHRLCALIKLNMTPKEMASVLNVAPNSIKSSRYRLKKKLGLDMNADLEEYIRKI